MPSNNHYPGSHPVQNPEARVLDVFTDLSGRTSDIINSTTPPQGIRLPHAESLFAKNERVMPNSDGSLTKAAAIRLEFPFGGDTHTATVGLVMSGISRQHRQGGQIIGTYAKLDTDPSIAIGLKRPPILAKFIPTNLAEFINPDVYFGAEGSRLQAEGRDTQAELPHTKNIMFQRTAGFIGLTLDLFTQMPHGDANWENTAVELVAAHHEMTQPIPPEEKSGRFARMLGKVRRQP